MSEAEGPSKRAMEIGRAALNSRRWTPEGGEQWLQRALIDDGRVWAHIAATKFGMDPTLATRIVGRALVHATSQWMLEYSATWPSDEVLPPPLVGNEPAGG